MTKRCNSCFRGYDEALGLCPYCGYEDGDGAAEPYFLQPGMVLNERYVVGEVLGYGGFGITYKAWDMNLDIVVAIKEYFYASIATRQPGTQTVLIYAQNRREEFAHFLGRFLDEARYTAKFGKNNNIVSVFEFFEANNTAYIVMEYLDGIPLNEYIKKNSISIDQCIAITLSVCAGLKTVHSEGVIHRDISPDNIMLCANGKVKLFDFGAARFSKNEEQQAMKLTQVMKPGFSPPEQYQTVSRQGAWTDIYALGASLYYMITGIKPVESTNRIEEGRDALIAPRALRAEIPEYVNNSILRAMAVETHLRFSSIDEFEKALTREKKVRNVARERKRRRRNRLLGLVAAVLAVAGGFSAFGYYYLLERDKHTLPDATIEFWYALPESGDPARSEAKALAYESAVGAFLATYPETGAKIVLVPFSADAYVKSVNDAFKSGSLPQLFESEGLDESVLQKAMSLEPAVKSINENSVLFFSSIGDAYPDYKQMPLGFAAPVLYTNLSLAGEGGAAEDADGGRAGFLRGEARSYAGSTADYYEITNTLLALPARYSIAPRNDADAACMFMQLVSVGDCDRDQLKLAHRFLAFMLGEAAQDYLHIQYRSGALPLNRTALTEGYAGTYVDFAGFFDDIEDGRIIGYNGSFFKGAGEDANEAPSGNGANGQGEDGGQNSGAASPDAGDQSGSGGMLPAEPETPPPLPPDLSTASEWAREGILSAFAKGFIPADFFEDFRSSITRADCCRIAVRFLEYQYGQTIDDILDSKGLKRDAGVFTDTKDPDLLAAHALGIASGIGGGLFSPEDEFTREQVAVTIRNVCAALGMDVGAHAASGFTDIGDAAPWAVDSIDFVSEYEIMSGFNDHFYPTGMLTREQCILSFNNINIHGEHE